MEGVKEFPSEFHSFSSGFVPERPAGWAALDPWVGKLKNKTSHVKAFPKRQDSRIHPLVRESNGVRSAEALGLKDIQKIKMGQKIIVRERVSLKGQLAEILISWVRSI